MPHRTDDLLRAFVRAAAEGMLLQQGVPQESGVVNVTEQAVRQAAAEVAAEIVREVRLNRLLTRYLCVGVGVIGLLDVGWRIARLAGWIV